jgi:hypothetical protein
MSLATNPAMRVTQTGSDTRLTELITLVTPGQVLFGL